MPDWVKNKYLVMVAWKKKLECIRNLHLTQRGLDAFGLVIDFVKSHVLEFPPPKNKN